VIPVLDLRAGRAVLARGGRREAYEPVRSVLVAPSEAGDPLALARAYRDTLRCDEVYVADLDAIGGGSVQRALLRGLSRVGVGLLVDAGVATPEAAQELVADGARRVVVGLETLPSFDALAAVASALGRLRVAFSLDLRAGVPLVRATARPADTPLALAHAAVSAGAGTVIILDLDRVGSGRGVDLHLVELLRRAHPHVELLAGGGVGTLRDLARLADAGLDGALVAMALHDGTLTSDDIVTAPREDHRMDSR